MLQADAVGPEPLWRRAARLLGTVGVVCLAAGMGIAGHAALSARAEAAGDAPVAPPTEVRAERLRLEASMRVERRFTGQFEARQDTALAFEEAGTLAEVMVREGDAVAAGAVLARIDTRLLEAERARLDAQRQALLAQAELARRTNERQGELQARGHAAQARIDETSLRLAQLTAGLAEIDAALVTVAVRLEKAVLHAPFAGRVGSRLADTGAVVSIGHSNATATQVRAALHAGARNFTHLYNAMSQMEGRAPGVVGAAIVSDADIGIICDGIHVCDDMVGLAIRTHGAGRMHIVSDAMPTVGGPTHFTIYGQQIALHEGAIINAEGSLAGAHTTMAEGVRRLTQRIGLTNDDALGMAITNPARVIGCAQTLDNAMVADVLVWGSENLLDSPSLGLIYG